MSRIWAPRKLVSPQLLVRTLQDYFWQSSLPLTIALFLLPLIIFYEVGTFIFAYDIAHHTETRVLAFNMMRRFFALFGATGRFLPALAVVGILFFWHLARRDPWKLHFGAAAGLALESFFLAFPLLALSMMVRGKAPLAATSASLGGGIVLAIGAGIYEELVFRLIALTLLNIILIDLLRVEKRRALIVMLLASGLLFAAYHHWSPASPALEWQSFVFRTLSGIYLGVLFIFRGFGVSAGTHAAYDVYYFCLMALSGR